MQGGFYCAPFLCSFLRVVNITFPQNLITLDRHYSDSLSANLLRLSVIPVSTTKGAFGATW